MPVATECAGGLAATRYVALLPPAETCASDGDWNGRPLFRADPALEPEFEEIPQTWPSAFSGFCEYTWQGEGSPVSAPTVTAVSIEPDCNILLPQAPAPAPAHGAVAAARDALRQRQADETLQHVDVQTTSLGAGAAIPYVAVVDTADSRRPGTPTPTYWSNEDGHAPQRHGLMMVALVDTIRCRVDPTERCRDRQFSVQAFPYGRERGELGSLGSLAQGIATAVRVWRQQPDATDVGLIINLSVGWELRGSHVLAADHMGLLDRDPSTVPATVRAVHAALAWAQCQGALPLAAAGNNRGLVCEQAGPVGPAAWERSAAPTPEECARHFGGGGVVVPAGMSASLVYAVGATDAANAPIAISRRNSSPARVQYGHKAVVAVDDTAYSEPWTGTSVPTAVASAIAAQIASHNAELTAAQIVDIIDRSGTPVGRSADVYLDGRPAPTVRRIDPHEALRLASAQPSAATTVASPAAISSAWETFTSSRFPPVGTAQVVDLVTTPSPDCSPESVASYAKSASRELASVASGLDPGTRPQPHIPICPDCPIESAGGMNYTLRIDIAKTHSQSQFDQPTLGFLDPATNQYLLVDLDETIDPQVPITLSLQSYQLGGGTLAGWLHQRPQIKAGVLGFMVDDPNSNPPQLVTEEIDVLR